MADVPVTITLSYDTTNGSITASPSIISAPSGDNADLVWAVGTNVQTINNITAPTTSGGQSLGTPIQSTTNGVWSLDDMVNNSNTYTYTVTIYTGSQTVTSDPQIINNPT
jgi:hypothetical protein